MYVLCNTHMYGFRSTFLIRLHPIHNWRGVIDQSVRKAYMMHASILCGLFPQMSPDIPRNRLTVSMLQQEPSTVLILHFSVARCIISIMANTPLVSETLLTKRDFLFDALQAYTCTCSYYACKYSCLLLWHIVAPGAVFSCNFDHKSIVTDLQYCLSYKYSFR